MKTESSDETAKGWARELLKAETCVHCAHQGYRLATLLWVVTAARNIEAEGDAETRAWLNDMHASAVAAFARGDREALARLALEIVPAAAASLGTLRDDADPEQLREFLDAMLEKVKRA